MTMGVLLSQSGGTVSAEASSDYSSASYFEFYWTAGNSDHDINPTSQKVDTHISGMWSKATGSTNLKHAQFYEGEISVRVMSYNSDGLKMDEASNKMIASY
jgi:hypothetical protein